MRIDYKIINLLLILIFFSCNKEEAPEVVNEPAEISGSVYYVSEEAIPEPIGGALVTIKNFYAQTLTDEDGDYNLTLDLTSEEQEITVQASKVGFYLSEIKVFVKRGVISRIPDITLTSMIDDSVINAIDTTGSSGTAANIELFENNINHIFVSGSGLTESAMLTFVVSDSQGRPLDTQHKKKVSFSILSGPGGGEYIFPDTMTTKHGKAYTVLNSGIISGPVQLLASVEESGQIIQSYPTRIAIHGGFPDGEHFSAAVATRNIAGQVHAGIIDSVTSFVGDKFSNPVAPGTIVYFSSDYGIMQGSAATDAMGRASAAFMSAAPMPVDSSSLAQITAWTYGDTSETDRLTTSNVILLSNATAPIVVTPDTFSYTNANLPVDFTYTVSDIMGNPLVGQTRISVSAEKGELTGDINVTLDDGMSKGPGRTEFEFSWSQGDDTLKVSLVGIKISAVPPADGNGSQATTIKGRKQ